MSSPNTPDEVVLCWALAHLLTHYIADVDDTHFRGDIKDTEVVKQAIHAMSLCKFKYPEDYV